MSKRRKWKAQQEIAAQNAVMEKCDRTDGHVSTSQTIGCCKVWSSSSGGKVWTSNLEIVDKCDKNGIYLPHCYITQDAYCRMLAFLTGADDRFHGREVGFYLFGDISNPEAWTINGIHIPNQRPINGSVADMESLAIVEGREIIGVAHIWPVDEGEKHRSGPDKDTLEGNHAISLTFGKGFTAIANVRIKLPCGAYRMAQALPEILFDGAIADEAIVALDKIETYVKEYEEKNKGSNVKGDGQPRHIAGFKALEKIEGGWRYEPINSVQAESNSDAFDEADAWLAKLEEENKERKEKEESKIETSSGNGFELVD
jgi:hypothetical protein